MKRLLLLVLMLSLCSCGHISSSDTSPTEEPLQLPTTYIQEFEQLHISRPEPYIPINYDKQIGKWFPYTQYDDYMRGKSADEFRKNVSELYKKAADEGVNTVYLHVHPFGDAYYESKLFPNGGSLDGNYDTLAIMLEEAHKLKLSAHAWINPLRCQTKEQMNELSDEYILKKWADDKDADIIKLVDNRWYLDPSKEETRQLIADCVNEIIENYDVDGIHIDDYFYPTTDKSFDKKSFAQSGSGDLATWRMSNCTKLVKTIYNTVKKHDKNLVFGISPQGSITADYETQYADVKLWGGISGYCDYIVPQIYYGFKNAACPFEKMLAEWEKLRGNSGVRLIIGLAAYKQGKADKWAGDSGENEWIEDKDIIKRQKELVNESSADGYAIYG